MVHNTEWEAPERARRPARVVVVLSLAVVALALWARGGVDEPDPIAIEPDAAGEAALLDEPPQVPPAGLGSGTWERLPAAPVDPPTPYTGVWIGHELVVWGVDRAAAYTQPRESGRLLPDPPLEPRLDPVMAWTGSEVLVWGGTLMDEARQRPDGAAYNPATEEWRPMAISPLPYMDVVVSAWTGDELVVWGALGAWGAKVAGRYDPAEDRWSAIPLGPVQRAIVDADGVWTGEELIVWGMRAGMAGTPEQYPREPFAARYHPHRGWRYMDPPPLADPLQAAAVWSGREVILWDPSVHPAGGAALNPETGQWRALSPVPQPDDLDRSGQLVGVEGVWASWQGLFIGGEGPVGGWAYDAVSDQWASLELDWSSRTPPLLAWTGRQLYVWGDRPPPGDDVYLLRWTPDS
jgi:hypothetical protein